MWYHHFQARIARRHVVRQHVDDRPRGFGRILIHGQRRGLRRALLVRRGAVGMYYYDGSALVEHLHERLQGLVAEVLAAAVGGQFHAVGLQRVERVDGLADGGGHVGQRQRRAEQEPSGVFTLRPGRRLVHEAYATGTFSGVAEIRLGRGHCQHGRAYARAVHEGYVACGVPRRQRKRLFKLRPVGFQRPRVFRHDDVRVHVEGLCGRIRHAECGT